MKIKITILLLSLIFILSSCTLAEEIQKDEQLHKDIEYNCLANAKILNISVRGDYFDEVYSDRLYYSDDYVVFKCYYQKEYVFTR